MLGGFEPAEVLGEDLECARDRSLDDDRRSHGGVCCLDTHCISLCRLLDDRLVGRERLGPEAVEFGPKHCQPIRVDLVDALLAGSFVDDETGVLQHLQMLRDRRPADGQLTGQLADRAGVLDQPLENRPPGRISQCRPAIRRVSHH